MNYPRRENIESVSKAHIRLSRPTVPAPLLLGPSLVTILPHICYKQPLPVTSHLGPKLLDS
jgi:hypothetical protein